MKVDPIYTEAVLTLMARPEEFVPASALAPIVKMHPSVIIEYAKNGNWPFCKYVISGNHVKFARIDFLRHFGFIKDAEKEVDPETGETEQDEDSPRETMLIMLGSLKNLLEGNQLVLDGIKILGDGQQNILKAMEVSTKAIIEAEKILLDAIQEQNNLLKQIILGESA